MILMVMFTRARSSLDLEKGKEGNQNKGNLHLIFGKTGWKSEILIWYSRLEILIWNSRLEI